jgi:putative cell wall-binding protein
MYPRYLQAPRPSVGVRAFDPVERIAGDDRYRTAAEASRERWFEGSPGAIVIARGDQAGGGADALAGSPLAAAKGGPLLLNPPDQLHPEVRIEVRRFTDHNMVVYLLGGPQALSPAVEQAITDMGVTVRRIAGADRYDTAVKIAEELGNPSTLFEADGTGFADALTAGAAAAHVNAAILLTDGNLQSPATGAYLAQHSTTTRYAVGGPAALADPTATRIAGADRYETAVAVAQRFFGDGPDIGLASGTGFADGLPAGAFLFQVNAPLLLTAPTATLPPSVQSYLSDHASALHCARVFGGTTVVPESIRDVIRDTISAS